MEGVGPVQASSRGSSLRVAVVAPPWYEVPPSGYGGIERLCSDLVEGLVGRGHDVTLVAVGTSSTKARLVAPLPKPPYGLGRPEGPGEEARWAAVVFRALEELDVDLVHDHSLAGPLVALGRAVPTVLTCHGPLHSWVEDYYGALGMPVVAISDAQRQAAPALPWVATIHNAIDVSAYRFSAAKDDYALFLGRMSPEKGAHLAPAAARAAGVRLVMAGKCNEPEELRYFDETVAPACGPETTWVGEVGGAQRKELLAGARCLLVPVQWEEPFGLVLAEALASGTPVVGLARGAVPEIVRHGETGWVCDAADELGHYVARAGEIDPEACRRDALRRFDLPVFVERHEHMYRGVVSGLAS